MKKGLTLLLFILAIGTSILIIIFPSFDMTNSKRVTTHKEFKLNYILNDKKNIEILFFGFSGCTTICTPRLSDLASWYRTLSPKVQDNINIKFFDISQPEKQNLPHEFAQAFHQDFIGIYLNKDVFREYTQTFSIYFTKIKTMEMNHTSHIYIVEKKDSIKALKYIYNTYPYDFELLTKDIKDLIHG